MAGAEINRSLLIEELDLGDDGSLSELHRDVFTPNFPADELDDEATMATGLRSGTAMVSVARAGSGDLLGGVVGEWFAASGVMLLSYIATRPGSRSGGVGTRLLTAAKASWSERHKPSLIVAEVEDPRYHDGVAYGEPWSRLRFYGRLGCRALDLPYFQPALGAGRRRVTNLLLMVVGGDAADPAAASVDGGLVECFLVEYFELCEGPIADGDLAATRMLAACRAPGGLRLLPPGELPPALG